MSEQLRAVQPIDYPIGASLELVRERGGRSQLTEEERAGLELRHVEPGDPCDDLPEESREWMLEQGLVEVVGWPDGLPPGAISGLEGKGVGTDAVAGMSDEELLAISGVGPGSLRILREAFGREEE